MSFTDFIDILNFQILGGPRVIHLILILVILFLVGGLVSFKK